MPRTTEVRVRRILKVKPNAVEEAALTEAIETANILVSRLCVASGKYDETVAADVLILEQIERYLAAHFFCVFKPRVTSEKAGQVSVTYAMNRQRDDIGLGMTSYGQQVKVLDVSGTLKAADAAQSAESATSITSLASEIP